MSQVSLSSSASMNSLSKFFLYSKKITAGLAAASEGFYLVSRHSLYKQPNNPQNTCYVQHFCRQWCKASNIEFEVRGEIRTQPAVWFSNHASCLDVRLQVRGGRVCVL